MYSSLVPRPEKGFYLSGDGMNVLSCIIFSVGLTSLFAQSLFLRELVVAFYGNEISVGIILSSWLVFTGLGSLLSRHIFKKSSPGSAALSFLLLIFSVSVGVQFLLIQSIRPVLGHFPGEIFSLGEIFWCGLVILAPAALVNGMLFALSVRLMSSSRQPDAAAGVYGLDSLGDMTGGILFAFWAALFFRPWQNAYGVSVALLFLAAAALFTGKKRHAPRALYIALGAVSLMYVFIGFHLGQWEEDVLSLRWRGFDVVEARSSLYGDVVLTREGGTFGVYENGMLSFSFPDTVSAEEIVHVVFSQAPGARRVLIVGGGLGGVLSEVLKYPVEEIIYLELNPVLVELVKEHLPAAQKQIFASSRLTVVNQDARAFLHRYRGEKFDVVLMNTPMPYSLSVNRFYTREYFASIRKALSSAGVFSFAIDSQQGYMASSLRRFASSMFHTLKDVFPQGILVPGKRLRFIAGGGRAVLSESPFVLAQRFKQYDIPTRYFSAESFASIFLPWQIQYAHRVLERTRPVKINRDFEPAGYYYSLNYFVSHFRSRAGSLAAYMARISPGWYYLISLGGLCGLFFWRRRRFLSVGVCMMGAAGMVITVLSVIAFQMIYGYVYHRIGFIGAGFMLGSACGVYIVRKYRLQPRPSLLSGILFAAGIYSLSLPYLFAAVSAARSTFLADTFPWFPFVCGIGVGMFFSLACKHPDSSADAAQRAGYLYGLDMIGAAGGGIVTSVLFFPLYGLENFSLLLGGVLILTAIFSYLSLKMVK